MLCTKNNIFIKVCRQKITPVKSYICVNLQTPAKIIKKSLNINMKKIAKVLQTLK